MAIDDAELRHLLVLARLDLEPHAAERVKHDLNRVLEYVETLSELDTEGVEPLVRPLEVGDALRADEPAAPLPRDAALALGRADEDGRFLVPRTVDEGN
jgi:aspartyl-tRNA(Asn)/glutamyl-tRNA(Gln) amidotransferase subunit C